MNTGISLSFPPFLRHPRRSAYLISGILSLVIVTGIGQDFINSRINESAFYLSESSLFKVVWLLFIPSLISIARYPGTSGLFRSPATWLRKVSFSLLFSLVHIFIAACLIRMLSHTLFDHTFGVARVFRYFVSENLIIIWLTYLIYPAILISVRTGNERTVNEKKRDNPLRFLVISRRGTKIPVDVRDIQYIRTDRPYLAIVSGNYRYLYSSSLQEIAKGLDSDHFVRIHRSSIVNIAHIACLRSRSNGDYDIEMKNGDTIRMSRKYTMDFRRLMNPARFSL